jgi:membrane protein required for colicin V production
MDGGITLFDLAVAGFLLLSALWAFLRGFVRELLGVAAWVGAAFATLYGAPFAQPYARQLISVQIVADIVVWVVIFVVSLILFSIISGAISSQVRQSSLSAIDRSLGFVFGLVRGAVIVCIGYMLLKMAVPLQDRPGWITSARSVAPIEQGVAILEQLIPRSARDRGAAAAERAKQEADQAAARVRALETLTSPPVRSEPPRDQPGGYSNQDKRAMDRLIQQESQGKQ